MFVSKIHLKNFRCYYSLKTEFQKGINIFNGQNGSGKTNLLEAIYYLSIAKSFREVNDASLIKYNEEYAVINGEINENDTINKIDILINQNNKKILINDKSVNKLSSLNQISNIIIFTPKDTDIFKGSPKNRRQYLDINASKLYPGYTETLLRFNLLLKERNELLKDGNCDKTQLQIITEKLIIEEKEIVKIRSLFIDNINKIIPDVAKKITGKENLIKIVYFPFLQLDDSFNENAKKLYQENLDYDFKSKSTSKGIHRDNFILNFNNKDIAVYGSQGENRLMAIALKLSPYFLNKDNKHPIVALDDVLSELDENHKGLLIEFLKTFEQVFITSTKEKFKGSYIYQIFNNQITRRYKL